MQTDNLITYLRSQQYANGKNLEARIRLHKLFGTNKTNWFRWVIDHLPLEKDLNVLEIGCGPGYLWKENADRIPDSWNIYITDFSPGMVHESQNNLPGLKAKKNFTILDAQNISFRSAIFDVVIANHMLYHVPDRQKAFAEIQRVLKPAGIFYAATNGEKHMQEMFDIGSRLVPQIENQSRANFSAYLFTLENGASQLSGTFNHIEIDKFSDSLCVTEAEPLIAYILSIVDPFDPNITQDKISNFQEIVDQTIHKNGSITINKSNGLFIATNKNDS